MLFAIHALDFTGVLPTRLANYDAHKAFLSDTARFGVKIVISGPLVSDDGEKMIGSLFLVEAPGRDESKHSIAQTRSLQQVSGNAFRLRDLYGAKAESVAALVPILLQLRAMLRAHRLSLFGPSISRRSGLIPRRFRPPRI